jgi:hypothetical protein
MRVKYLPYTPPAHLCKFIEGVQFPDMRLFSAIRLAGVIAVLSTNAFAWGGGVHMDINRAAAMNVPDEMAAWRAYAAILTRESIRPDLWKGSDETEGPRHYLDAERYQPLAITNLPEDHAKVRALNGGDAAESGILPWVIMDVENRLTQAMASNEWEAATRYAAALGHYVADAHQPLHLTEHYDGSPGPDGKGIHMRWEEQMPFFFWKAELIKAGPAEYIKDLWSTILRELDQAHARYREIYAADHESAEAADDDVGSSDYYRAMWKRTQGLFTEQVNAAVTDLSSLWYTAWVKAGRPEIPKPPVAISETSIWKDRAAPVRTTALPFLLVLAGVGVIALIISMACRRA